VHHLGRVGRCQQLRAGHAPAVLAFELVNVATRSVRELCRIAAARPGCTLRAATSHGNAASQKVLAKAGFIPAGPATPADLGGKSGTWYQRDLQP
jgi:[ribosomal protein S5]-alanine N-acetyltransferase